MKGTLIRIFLSLLVLVGFFAFLTVVAPSASAQGTGMPDPGTLWNTPVLGAGTILFYQGERPVYFADNCVLPVGYYSGMYAVGRRLWYNTDPTYQPGTISMGWKYFDVPFGTSVYRQHKVVYSYYWGPYEYSKTAWQKDLILQ